MKTPPLGFTEENFCAVLSGIKTETRRLLTVRDLAQELVNELKSFYQDGDGNWIGCSDDSPNHAEWVKEAYPKGSNQGIKSKYQVGDRCYLTEPTQNLAGADYTNKKLHIQYFWHNPETRWVTPTEHDLTLINKRKTGLYSWQNARFMLKSFARFSVEIAEVRLERLLDITAEAAIAEGIKTINLSCNPLYLDYMKGDKYIADPIQSYLSQIAYIHKPVKGKIGGWDLVNSNPWVWVYKFKLVTP